MHGRSWICEPLRPLSRPAGRARRKFIHRPLVVHCAHLLGHAEQMLDYDRRTGDIAMERDALQARVSDLEAERINRESELKEVDHARATLIERSASLARAFTAKEATLARAEDTIAALTERLGVLETALAADKQATEQQIEDLTAAVRREKLERAVVEGALETGRKDFGRLMREVMALQRGQQAAEDTAQMQAAKAA